MDEMNGQPKMQRDSVGIMREILYRDCLNCGRPYASINKYNYYCSSACSREATSRRRSEKHECPHCHKVFQIRGRLRIYCSEGCKLDHYAEKLKLRDRQFWFIMNRDNFSCQYCGRNPTEDGVKLALDHIKPKSDGGRDTFDNLVTSCKQCNCSKHSRPLRYEAEFRKRIQRRTGSLQTAFDFMTRPLRET